MAMIENAIFFLISQLRQQCVFIHVESIYHTENKKYGRIKKNSQFNEEENSEERNMRGPPNI